MATHSSTRHGVILGVASRIPLSTLLNQPIERNLPGNFGVVDLQLDDSGVAPTEAREPYGYIAGDSSKEKENWSTPTEEAIV